TSPFLASPARIIASVSGFMMTVPSATAVRLVSALSPTSTMLASPELPRCVSRSAPIASARSEQCAGRGSDVLLAHEAFAHQEGGDAGAGKPTAVLVAEDAAFADDEVAVRHHRRQPLRSL